MQLNVERYTANADVKMILVGNKCDLKESRAVETSRGKVSNKIIHSTWIYNP